MVRKVFAQKVDIMMHSRILQFTFCCSLAPGMAIAFGSPWTQENAKSVHSDSQDGMVSLGLGVEPLRGKGNSQSPGGAVNLDLGYHKDDSALHLLLGTNSLMHPHLGMLIEGHGLVTLRPYGFMAIKKSGLDHFLGINWVHVARPKSPEGRRLRQVAFADVFRGFLGLKIWGTFEGRGRLTARFGYGLSLATRHVRSDTSICSNCRKDYPTLPDKESLFVNLSYEFPKTF